MRAELCVVPSPALYFVSGVLQRHKPVHVQAFVPETAVERFDVGIIRRRAETGVIELDFVEIRPSVEYLGNEIGAVVYLDPSRQTAGCIDFFQRFAGLLVPGRPPPVPSPVDPQHCATPALARSESFLQVPYSFPLLGRP